MKAHHHLVKYLIDHGHALSVDCYGENFIKHSADAEKVIYELESVELAQLSAFRTDDLKNCVAIALVIPYDVGDDETVADYSDNELMKLWLKAYEGENL